MTAMFTDETDEVTGSPAWRALQWRAGRREQAVSSVPLRKITCARQSGGATLKAGVFAGIHGDEPAGTEACLELARWADSAPRQLSGYELCLYPECNPSGLRAGTRHSREGLDLNREFWCGSNQPEVRWLE